MLCCLFFTDLVGSMLLPYFGFLMEISEMAVTLDRQSGSVVFDPENLIDFSELGQLAEQRLGYALLNAEIVAEKQKIRKDKPLLDAMEGAGIKPFTEDSLKSYKHGLVSKVRPLKFKIGENVGCLGVASLITSVLIGLVACVAGCGGQVVLCGVVCGAASVILMIIGFGALGGNKTIRISWNLVPIQDYGNRIPEFALQTALDLQQRYPDSQFFIDEATYETVSVDPFLVVKAKRSKRLFYLEVWNEPEYREQREI